MAASVTDKFTSATNGSRPSPTTLTATHTGGDTTMTCNALTGWPTDTAVHFIIYTTDTDGNKVAGSQTDWKGVVSGSTITNCVLKAGTDSGYSIGAVVECAPTAAWADDLTDGLRVEHDQDGTHSDITATSVTATSGTFTSLTVTGTATSQGWTPLGDVPDTVTYNGNRNYDIVMNGVDHTSTLSPGMKLQLTRTVAAPDQCASLNGSTNYFNRVSASVAGMTFTNNFVVSAWVKLTSYNANDSVIASRFNGTSGWEFAIDGASGQVFIRGYNGGVANVAQCASYAAIPLNKWVHVCAQLDMTNTTNDGSNNYVMIDGVNVTAVVNRGGTSPTSLVQAGNLEIGSHNGGTKPFPGAIAQVAIFNAKVTQATMRTYMSQGLTGSETSLISAYSFDNSLNDLNTTNANNLTANGGAVATNADSPFANAVSAGLLEYAEINSVAFSTNTTVNVRVPDTCMIPTSGGVSAVSYSTQSDPYGLPYFTKVLAKTILMNSAATTTTGSHQDIPGLTLTAYIPPNAQVKLKFHVPRWSMSAGGAATAAIREGSTVIADTTINVGAAWDATISSPESIITPTVGNHTYKASFGMNSAMTLTLYAGNGITNYLTTTEAYISVELV